MKHKLSGYLTSNQAAKQLGVTRQRVSILLKEGRIPFKVAGRFRLIKQVDLNKFASTRCSIRWPPTRLP